MTNTFLNDASLDTLRGLLGAQLRAYGTDLELDEGVGAFGAWLDTDRGVVEVEFVEQVIDFGPAAGGERVESVLEARDGVADGDAHDEVQQWEWWRDSGLRISLDSGEELVLHCKSPVQVEVAMLAGRGVTLPAPPKDFQEHQARKYDYGRREVSL